VRSTYESFRQEILDDLKAALPVDMVFLDMHGAMLADGYDDCEGDLLAHIRRIVGADVPIGATLDPHCHLTDAMVKNATALVMLKEYPHVDFVERAQELLAILTATVEGKIHPRMSVFDCRMILLALHTTREPGRGFVDQMQKLEKETDGVLSISLCHGMQWGDVPEMGTKVLVITDNQPELGNKVAADLGRHLFDIRNDIKLDLLSVDKTLERISEILSRNPDKPIVVADFTDNPGGGAPGDATFILKALLDKGMEDVVIATIWDPMAVNVAFDAGEGANLNLRIGGKTGVSSGSPLDVYARVKKTAKNVTQTFAGNPNDIGNAAVIQVNGIDVIINSLHRQIFGVDCLTNLDIDPASKKIIVVKSSQHFYASFAPIAAEVIYCVAPGTLMMDIPNIPYKRIDKNKWPLVENPFTP
jgi:microcystin degradation protein MlrC